MTGPQQTICGLIAIAACCAALLAGSARAATDPVAGTGTGPAVSCHPMTYAPAAPMPEAPAPDLPSAERPSSVLLAQACPLPPRCDGQRSCNVHIGPNGCITWSCC